MLGRRYKILYFPTDNLLYCGGVIITTKNYSLTVIALYICGTMFMLASPLIFIGNFDVIYYVAIGLVLFAFAKIIRLLKRIEEASAISEENFIENLPKAKQPYD